MNRNKEILFEITEDALLVANGGRAFSRTGVLSVCASHLSDKLSETPKDLDCSESELVQKIRDKELRTYQNDPNRITSDFRSVDETRRDYDGRFIWELLQNADDAMKREDSGDLIGSKGLGFKSVLEITDEPEIHSDLFHFRFSAEQTQDLLKERKLHDSPPPLTFRIPHENKPCEIIKEHLRSGYTTVVRLPFRDDKAREKGLERLRSLEPLFLLLVHELSRVRVRTSEGETVHEIVRGFSNGDVKLNTKGLNRSQSTTWRKWDHSKPAPKDNGKRLTVSIYLPLTERGDPIPYGENVPLYVFFPTEEKIEARALLHASLDLQQNRKRVRESEHDDDILRVFSELFQEVLKAIPARTALEAFGGIASEDEDSPLGRLQKGIRETLCETPFVPVIGSEKVKPAEVRLWSDRLGFVLRTDAQEVRDARLLVPQLRDLSGVLKSFNARYIEAEDYIRLLRHCRNDSLEECLASWRAWAGGGLKRPSNQWGEDRKKSLEWLREVPCWWTEPETARAFDGVAPLLRARPEDWPDWLPADSLHPAMRKMLQQWEIWLKKPGNDALSKEFKECISGRLLEKENEFLHNALLPFLAEWDGERWQTDGWRALRQVLSWSSISEFEKVSPWVEPVDGNQAEKQRARVVETLRLPTDKGWLPAADCYAGEAWGGPAAFDRFFADVEKRGLVLPFSKWPDFTQEETNRDEWKPLLRWVGVSWEPKVQRIKDRWYYSDLPSDYRDSITNMRSSGSCIYNWNIEYFPACMQDDDAKPADVIRMMLPLVEAVRKHKAAYRPSNRHRNNSSCENFAYFQLRHKKWLPCKIALLHDGVYAAPRGVLLPDKGLGGLLPEVDRRGIEDVEWFGPFIPVLRDLGVRDELPKDSESLHGWMRKLSELTECDNNKEEDIRKAADALYRRYLKLDGNGNEFPPDILVPCLSWENNREKLTFAPLEQVFHVDEPHFDEVKQKIMQKVSKLFILGLSSGKDAPERLGVGKLSEVLEVEPHYGERDEQANNKLLERYRERRLGLELAAKLDKSLPKNLALIAVHKLRLELTGVGNGAQVASVEVLSWRQADESLLINLDKNEWRALGHGLAEWIARKADKASLFENLLREDEKEGYLDRLRHEGVTEDDIKRAESTWKYKPEGDQAQNLVFGGPGESGLQPQLEEEDGQVPGSTTQDGPSLVGGDGSRSPGQDHSHQVEQSARDSSVGERSRERDDTGGSHHSETGKGAQRPRPETGFPAEDWFEQGLEKAFPGRVERRVRDTQNRESDFVVIMNGGDGLHIEVKHSENHPGTFYWSGLECEKALTLEGTAHKYVMAILFPDGEEGYEIRWIWRPLDELMRASRAVQWEGNSDYESVDTDSWDVTEQQPVIVPAKRHVFRIKLSDEILESFDKDDGSLDVLRKKIS